MDKYDNPIHNWFQLTYSSYLILPRLILQAMPEEWQQKLVDLLEEVQEVIEFPDDYTASYSIQYRVNGKIASDPYRDYRRGTVKYKDCI